MTQAARPKFRGLPSAIIGRLGEMAASAEFKKRGASVIASYQFSGSDDNHAPALEYEQQNTALPDLDVSHRGRRRWIEIKTYERAPWNEKHGCFVHGIPVRAFDNYVSVERETGSEVYLAIVELGSGLMIVSGAPLSQLPKFPCQCSGNCRSRYREKHVANDNFGIREMQWYFDREHFVTRWDLNRKALAEIRTEHERRMPGHAQRRHGTDRETPRTGAFATTEPEHVAGWTWTHLACNATWIGDANTHRCPGPVAHVRGWFLYRLGRAAPNLTDEQVEQLVDRPIARTELARYLGERWLTDDLSHMTTSKSASDGGHQ